MASSGYTPKKIDPRFTPDWLMSPKVPGGNLGDHLAKRVENRKNRAYTQIVEAQQRQVQEEEAVRDIIAEAMQSQEGAGFDDALTMATDEYARRGLLEQALKLESQAALTDRRNMLGDTGSLKAISAIAQTSPELAAAMYKQQGLDQIFGPINFQTMRKHPQVKGSLRSGLWQQDPVTGQVSVIRGPQASPKDPGSTMMQFPDGSVRRVPKTDADLDAALAAGGRPSGFIEDEVDKMMGESRRRILESKKADSGGSSRGGLINDTIRSAARAAAGDKAQSPQSPLPPAPPGKKYQRNVKTGEVRLVDK